ncbi:MAG: aromatic ring-hydroxylating dioxygenase subunit alpha [Oculatellaceae cyanobacterium Prado106]|jgi:choline monooxygenase|nr:aromatic ring-hydroxylating dioxygenase subunit alpha [Oculatellaceae cyanobacterium Prado106]
MNTDIETYLSNWQPQSVESTRSFPAEMYFDDRIYRLEQERIFGRQWLYAGHTSQLTEPGSYLTVEIAEQPLLIVRDLQNHLRGFFNVCTHRGGPVASGCGQSSHFTCLYHAWTFGLEGELKAAPYMQGAAGFDHQDYGLRPIRVETWGPLIFVNFDLQCEPLATQLGNLPEQYTRYNLSALKQVHSEHYEIDVNWKLYVENSSESYHVAMVHPALELFRTVNDLELNICQSTYSEYLPFLPHSDSIKYGFEPGLAIAGLNEKEMQGSEITLLYPNFAIVFSPTFVMARMISPCGVSKTQIRFDWMVPDTPEATAAENVAAVVSLYDRTVKEDLEMLKRVHVGVRSLHYTPGRLSPVLEIGTHHFQQLVMEQICS